jgi:hypothetical protein
MDSIVLAVLILEAVTQIPWIESLGAGGVVAGTLYMVYRDSERSRSASEERYAELTSRFIDIVESNTKAMTEVTAAVDHNTATTESIRQAIERLR